MKSGLLLKFSNIKSFKRLSFDSGGNFSARTILFSIIQEIVFCKKKRLIKFF